MLGWRDADEPLVEPFGIRAAERARLARHADRPEQRRPFRVQERVPGGALLGDRDHHLAQLVGDRARPHRARLRALRQLQRIAARVPHPGDPVGMHQLAPGEQRGQPRRGERRDERAGEPRAEVRQIEAVVDRLDPPGRVLRGGRLEQAHAPHLTEQRLRAHVADGQPPEALVVRDGERVSQRIDPAAPRGRHQLRRPHLVGIPRVATLAAREPRHPPQRRRRRHHLHQRGRRVDASRRERLRIGRHVGEDLPGRGIHQDHVAERDLAAREHLADTLVELRVDRVLDLEPLGVAARRGLSSDHLDDLRAVEGVRAAADPAEAVLRGGTCLRGQSLQHRRERGGSRRDRRRGGGLRHLPRRRERERDEAEGRGSQLPATPHGLPAYPAAGGAQASAA